MERISRRQALKLLGGGVAATSIGSSFSLARAATRRPRVAVFGAGVAGLTTTHELADRGFDVSLYEPRAWGGKVRSFGVPGTGSGGRAPLPAEHAVHHIFGAYLNLQDTLRRIPFGTNANGVYDNLVPLEEGYRFAEEGADPELIMPTGTATPSQLSPSLTLPRAMLGLLPAHEAAWALQRLAILLTSCDERRYDEWERVSWFDFLGAGKLSDDTQRALARTFVQNVAGQPAMTTSARAVGSVFELLVWHALGRSGDGPWVGCFDRPKNEAWVQPWVDHLTGMGATLHAGWTLRGFDMANGRIAGARVVDSEGRPQVVTADYYVSALPQERVPGVLSPAVLEAAPELAATAALPTMWCNAVMLYLRRPIPFNHGQAAYMDSPWALLGAPQAQFWQRNHDFARDFGDGTIVDCVSMCISDWDTPGVLYGKPARECSADEIAREVWAQIQRHGNLPDEPKLDDDLVATSYVDPGLIFNANGSRIVENQDPLFCANVDTWSTRPEATTSIPNLMLAGDWIRNRGFPLGATDAANEAGRSAAAAIVADSGVRAEPVVVNAPYRSPELEGLKQADAQLARAGLPHALDRPELVHVPGLATDVLATVEKTLGLKIPKMAI